MLVCQFMRCVYLQYLREYAAEHKTVYFDALKQTNKQQNLNSYVALMRCGRDNMLYTLCPGWVNISKWKSSFGKPGNYMKRKVQYQLCVF